MKKETILGLKNLNVDLLVLHYSGGGDSGAIDDVVYYKKIKNGNSDDLENFEEMIIKFDSKAIEDFAYPILNDIEDWWNNEGGNGKMFIDLESLEYKIENEIRVYDYEKYYHDNSFEITE